MWKRQAHSAGFDRMMGKKNVGSENLDVLPYSKFQEVPVAGYDIPAPGRGCAFEDSVVARIGGNDVQGKIGLHDRRQLDDKGDEFLGLGPAETKLRISEYAGCFLQKGW